MQITCNGKSQPLEDGATVAALLGQLQLSGPVAVEVNEQLAPREQHATWTLADGDRVEIVTLVGGG
jgi:sulfur carrier protein